MILENLTFIGAMNTPVAGRNDIPARVKRHFFSFAMVLPHTDSIDNIYGEMMRAFFTVKAFNQDVYNTANVLVTSTIQLWEKVKTSLLPTPQKFHYSFNMRELSRVFQGIFESIKVKDGRDVIMKAKSIGGMKPEVFMVGLWKHECLRTFEDKLVNAEDKAWVSEAIDKTTLEFFDREVADQLMEPIYFCDFMREDVYDADGELEEEAPKVYEGVKDLKWLRNKCN
jgi:dynein heavy chain